LFNYFEPDNVSYKLLNENDITSQISSAWGSGFQKLKFNVQKMIFSEIFEIFL